MATRAVITKEEYEKEKARISTEVSELRIHHDTVLKPKVEKFKSNMLKPNEKADFMTMVGDYRKKKAQLEEDAKNLESSRSGSSIGKFLESVFLDDPLICPHSVPPSTTTVGPELPTKEVQGVQQHLKQPHRSEICDPQMSQTHLSQPEPSQQSALHVTSPPSSQPDIQHASRDSSPDSVTATSEDERDERDNPTRMQQSELSGDILKTLTEILNHIRLLTSNDSVVSPDGQARANILKAEVVRSNMMLESINNNTQGVMELKSLVGGSILTNLQETLQQVKEFHKAMVTSNEKLRSAVIARVGMLAGATKQEEDITAVSMDKAITMLKQSTEIQTRIANAIERLPGCLTSEEFARSLVRACSRSLSASIQNSLGDIAGVADNGNGQSRHLQDVNHLGHVILTLFQHVEVQNEPRIDVRKGAQHSNPTGALARTFRSIENEESEKEGNEIAMDLEDAASESGPSNEISTLESRKAKKLQADKNDKIVESKENEKEGEKEEEKGDKRKTPSLPPLDLKRPQKRKAEDQAVEVEAVQKRNTRSRKNSVAVSNPGTASSNKPRSAPSRKPRSAHV